MSKFLKASKRVYKTVKRFLKSCVRPEISSTEPQAQGATVKECPYNCAPGMVCTADHPPRQPQRDLRRLHREAAVYPRTSCPPGPGEWKSPITWPNHSVESPQSSAFVVIDIQREDPVEVFEGSVLQAALGEDVLSQLETTSMVIPDHLCTPRASTPPTPLPQSRPLLRVTTPLSPTLRSSRSLPSASKSRGCPSPSLSLLLPLPSPSLSRHSVSYFSPEAPGTPTTPLTPLTGLCDESPLNSLSLSISSASDTMICYASSASAAEASLYSCDSGSLCRSPSLPHDSSDTGETLDLQELDEFSGFHLLPLAGLDGDDNDDVRSTKADTGRGEQIALDGGNEAGGQRSTSIWDGPREGPSKVTWAAPDSYPQNSTKPSSSSAESTTQPESNAGSTPLDPCFRKLPESPGLEAEDPLDQDDPPVREMLRHGDAFHRAAIGWLFSNSWLLRTVDKRVITRNGALKGSLQFYKFPNATFMDPQSDSIAIDDEKRATTLESRDRGVALEFGAGHSCTASTGDTEVSDSEGDDGEPTWEEVWDNYLATQAPEGDSDVAGGPTDEDPLWREVLAKYLQDIALKNANDSAGEVGDGELTWRGMGEPPSGGRTLG